MTGFVETGTYLDRILVRTAADLVERKASVPLGTLEPRAGKQPAPLSLRSALIGQHVSVISEIKRASPSKGVFPVDVGPATVAREYIAGGAAAISVLTDEPFFQGSLHDMANAAEVVHRSDRKVPILRKDFVIDEYQLVEARAFGADAALLIVAALTQERLVELAASARDLGLSALVEVHNEAELERAVEAGSDIIGINNRDLHSFHVDLAVSERLATLCPPSAVIVAESGIFTPDHVERLAQSGATAILVGEALITASDRRQALQALATVRRVREIAE
jgi:indole-3-glycerol phosphate synthase